MIPDKKQLLEGVASSFIYSSFPDRLPTEQEIKEVVSKLALTIEASDEVITAVITSLQSKQAISMDTGTSVNENFVPWLHSSKVNINFYYWKRYQDYLLYEKKWSKQVIATMDNVSDTLLDFLGNPKDPTPWQRRGLIIGDVQSGKTANYISLINKAADAGYKVIILLSGIIENLRRQTQERLDEGFIGRSSKAALQKNQQTIRRGVGKIDSTRFACAITTEASDFKINTPRSLNMSLSNMSEPVLFVTKKNARSLDNLIKWLKTYNLDANGLINIPLLLIDDEADNASINTREHSDPTRINKLIRQLLKLFKNASYVGVTATPFANIFIDPDTDEEMLGDDLFPRDYIYSLSPPSNYIGSNAIFGTDASYNNCLCSNEDAAKFFWFKHKVNHHVRELPPSLKVALRYFLLTNAIRDFRGDKKAHRSMLVNVSRFTAVQDQVKDLIVEWFFQVKNDVESYCKLSVSNAVRNNTINNLRETWEGHDLTSVTKIEWDQIQPMLYSSIASIEIRAINQRSSASTLDYDSYKDNGLRIIAVGGNSLSRGLTLEGLCVSYFYRNSQMYDTLMQMGRWFGFRSGYEDLFKIWMPESVIDWYSYITEATNELRHEILCMNQLRMTPKDFGLKVRAHPATLLVTAKNKMRSASTEIRWISLDGVFMETPRLLSEEEVIKSNQNAALALIENLIEQKNPEKWKNHYLWSNIPRQYVYQFIRNYLNHPLNMEMNTDSIADYIMEHDYYSIWDVLVPQGVGDEISFKQFPLDNFKMLHLKMDKAEGTLRVLGSKLRVGQQGLARAGLSSNQTAMIEAQFRRENPDKKSVPDRAYLIENRRPLLIIYFIQPKGLTLSFLGEKEPIIAYGMGIPNSHHRKSSKVKYVLNTVEQRKRLVDLSEDEDDDM